MTVQGDQYPISFKVKSGDGYVTPEDCQGVKAKVGEKTYEYPEKGLEFDSTSNEWKLQLMQRDTLCMKKFKMQIQINFGGNPAVIINSTPKNFIIEDGIIREVWK